METLLLIFKELAIIAGIVFLFLLIVAMVTAPFKNYKRQREIEKATNDFVNELVDEIFKNNEKEEKKSKK